MLPPPAEQAAGRPRSHGLWKWPRLHARSRSLCLLVLALPVVLILILLKTSKARLSGQGLFIVTQQVAAKIFQN